MISQYSVKLIVIPILWYLNKMMTSSPFLKFKSKKKFIKAIAKKMLFNEILIILLEAYFELLLAPVLNLKCESPDPDCNTLNKIISILITIIVAIVVPITICYVVYKYQKRKNDTEFITRWGAIIENFKNDSLWSLTYRIWFCLRRIIFIASVF